MDACGGTCKTKAGSGGTFYQAVEMIGGVTSARTGNYLDILELIISSGSEAPAETVRN